MATQLGIINMGLAHLAEITAQKRMTSVARENCNTDPQHACLDFYDECKLEMLAYMDWSRARKRKALTVSDDDPIIDGKWTYKYSRPSDCLVIRAIIDTSEYEYEWELGVEETDSVDYEWIYTSVADAYIRYTYPLAESRYTVGMAMLHSMILAERVAMTVTADEKKVEMVTTKLHKRVEILAQKLGASEGYVEDEHGQIPMTENF